jgi:predicted nucleic acid-binding protein
MKGKAFLDTNIFIYSIDASPGQSAKRDLARRIVRDHIKNDSGVLSIQVLKEFFQVATQKIEVPLSVEEALEYLHYIAILETVQPDFHLIVSAIHLHQKYAFSFWDSLILQAAKTAGCSRLLSEDLQHGFNLDGLLVRNPFKAGE